jgi:hypothetical protein
MNPTQQEQDYLLSLQINQHQAQSQRHQHHHQQQQQQNQSIPSHSQNYYNGSTLLGKVYAANDSKLSQPLTSCSLPQSASSLLSLSSNYSTSDVSSSLSTSNNLMSGGQDNSAMMMLMLDPTLSSTATQLSSSMQNDLLIAAGSVTNAMQTLCKELSAGENNQSNSNTSDDEVDVDSSVNNIRTNTIQTDNNMVPIQVEQFNISPTLHHSMPTESIANLASRQGQVQTASLSSSSTPVTYRRSLNNNNHNNNNSINEISNTLNKYNLNWSKSEKSNDFYVPNYQTNRMGINLDEIYKMESLNGTNVCNRRRDNENDGDDEDNAEEAENYLLANNLINELVKNDTLNGAQDFLNDEEEEDDDDEAAGLMQLSREQDEIINNHILITNLTNNNEIFRRELEQILIENNAITTTTTNNNTNSSSSSGSGSENNTEQEQQNEAK